MEYNFSLTFFGTCGPPSEAVDACASNPNWYFGLGPSKYSCSFFYGSGENKTE